MLLFKIKLIKLKYNLKYSSSLILAIFQVLNSPVWLPVTILDSADKEHSYHHLSWGLMLHPSLHCLASDHFTVQVVQENNEREEPQIKYILFLRCTVRRGWNFWLSETFGFVTLSVIFFSISPVRINHFFHIPSLYFY